MIENKLDKAPTMSKRNIINSITYSRLLLLPLFMVTNQYVPSLILIGWIGFSDFLDGFLARYWKQVSSFGATLDQWVDKIVSISLLLFFLYNKQLDLWFVTLFTIREFIVLLARRKKWCAGASSTLSKLKTFLTYLLFIALVALSRESFNTVTELSYFKNISEIIISFLSIMGMIVGMQPVLRGRYIRFISTGCYSSILFKKGPGTITTVVFFILFWYIQDVHIIYKVLITILLIVTHYIVFPIYIENQKSKDPAEYTLDEIVASAILFCFLSSNKIDWIIAILLFRFFDILKPLGIRTFEKAKAFSSTNSVLGDDIIAAFYSLILLEVFVYVVR